MTEEKKNNEEILMHFVIPYNWESVLRGLFWIFIFTLVFWSFLSYIAIHIAGMNYVCFVSGYIVMIAIYLLIRYVTIKYDRIKEKREIIVYREKFIYKHGDYKFEAPYIKTKVLIVKISDKEVYIRGDDLWEWRAPKGTIHEDVGYKNFVENTVIPFVNLIIKEIKKVNPNLHIVWNDTRKKYK